METPKLIVLGSAAAEGIPALFCDCHVCREAARLGGHEVRQRTSYNFGGDIQIDFGPDSLQAWQQHREALSKIRHVLITHAHEDHFQPSDFVYHASGFASVLTRDDVITIHGTEPTRARMAREFWLDSNETLEQKMERSRLEFHVFKQLDEFDLTGVNAKVRTFPADHARDLDPVVFVVTLRGRTVLVCNDTGYLRENSWEALAKLSGEVKIDVAVLDNTGMLRGAPGGTEGGVWDRGHMSAPTIFQTLDRLDELKLLAPDCIRAVNHFSHNGGSTHAEMVEFYKPHGITVCYDGIEL